MKRDFPDFFMVRAEHKDIHEQLINWRRVVAVHGQSADCSPIFRLSREAVEDIPDWQLWVTVDKPAAPDLQAGWKMEKMVRNLPEKHRDAIRWHYVRRTDPRKQARLLAVTVSVLHDLVHDGRSILKNRL